MSAPTTASPDPQKAAMDRLELLAISACASAEKLLELQLRAARGATDDALAYLRALQQARGVADVASAQANAMGTMVSATASYGASLFVLATAGLPGLIQELKLRA